MAVDLPFGLQPVAQRKGSLRDLYVPNLYYGDVRRGKQLIRSC